MINKPKMYQNKITKEFHNNRSVFNTSESSQILTSSDIIKKIKSIINAPNFIYSKTCSITLKDTTIVRKIIGIANNNLVTIDNEYIPITDIIDINVKEK